MLPVERVPAPVNPTEAACRLAAEFRHPMATSSDSFHTFRSSVLCEFVSLLCLSKAFLKAKFSLVG